MKNFKIRKNIGMLLLGASLTMSSLTGCGTSEPVVPENIEFVLDDMENHEDTKLQNYINEIPFSDTQFRESYYNYVTELSLKDTVMAYDYYEIEKLELSNLTSLEDLRLFPNLKVLVLKDCEVTDFSPISNLKLNMLEIDGSNIDCTMFGNTNTKALYLNNCTLSNTDSLTNMEGLEILSCKFSKVGNIDFIKNLEGLKNAIFVNADINDFSPLSSLKLESLEIGMCQVDDWSFLNSMTSLESLALSYTNFSDIRNILELKNLNSLDLSYTFITSIEGIESLKKLEYINLDSCHELSDYEPITGLKKLESANLTNLEMQYNYSTDTALGSKNVMTDIYDDDAIKEDIQTIYDSIGITDDMSEAEKVRLITMKVLDQLKYDQSFTSEDAIFYNNNELQTSIDGVGICCSYTGLTTALLDLAGIENCSIVGENILDDENYMHRWNIVKIDGKWYGLDTTFLGDLDAKNTLANGDDSIYYLDELNDEDWINYHYPYAMPNSVPEEGVVFAR